MIVIGVVKGMSKGHEGYIFVSIVLVPLLALTVMQLRWTDGESIDERLQKLAYGQAVVLFLLDIALMVSMLSKVPCQ